MPKPQSHEDAPDERTLQTLLALAGDEFLTPQQAAEELKVSRQTIYNWIHDDDPNNRLPATKAGGWKIRRGDLASYVRQKHSREAGSEPEKESDQTLRGYLLKLIECARAAAEFRHASQVFKAAQGAVTLDGNSYAFLERCGGDLSAKSEQLLRTAEDIDDGMLTRLRFMLPSITSSVALRAEESQAEDTTH